MPFKYDGGTRGSVVETEPGCRRRALLAPYFLKVSAAGLATTGAVPV
ncbi:MAG: hypothetical protein JWR71_3447 [Pseudarthrobacter sp.]|nr:hypothetical protein [Pseudarthrobacter sp.]